MKNHKFLKASISIILVLVLAALAPMQALAAANNGKYVSEVYVAYGKNAEEAKKTLEDKGFTPVEGNLNDGGKTYSMLGYKTTDNIRDSITDLSVMNMNGGYSVEDYKNFLKSQKNDIVDFLDEFMTVIQEYRLNLKNGKSKATVVHDLLNTFTDDDTGMKMGDLLASETLQDKVGIAESVEAENPDNLPDLVTILMQGNAQVLKTMEVLLSMAADAQENTWLDRFAESDYDALLDKVEDERPDLNTESKRAQYLENLYGDYALAVGTAVSNLRNKLVEYENSDLHIDTATEEDIKNAFGDVSNPENGEQLKNTVEFTEWYKLATIYEGLKEYEGGNFAKGEMLDFFLEENDPEDTELYIPMAAALSEGQRCGLPFVNFGTLVEYTFADEASWAEQAKKAKNSYIKEENLSVYANIDRDIYKDDGTVALTDAAQRAQNVASIGTEENTAIESDGFKTLTVVCIFASVLGIAASATGVYLAKGAVADAAYSEAMALLYDDISPYDDVILEAIYDNDAYDIYAIEHADTEVLELVDGARFAVTLSRIVIAVTIFIAVITTVLTVIDLLRDRSVEQLPIPKYLVDNYSDADGGSFTLNYKAVECNREEYFGRDYKIQKGICADLLADEGKQWLALYASKNSKAGKPLTPDFIIKKEAKNPSGYDGCVHLFGEKGAVNTVASAFKDYSAVSSIYQGVTNRYKVFVFYKFSNDTKIYDESAGNMTASTIRNGSAAMFGFGGMAIGLVIGAVCTALVNKNKKKKENGYEKS